MEPATVIIGEYELGETLGIGSFGKVKVAQHRLTGHKVAMKMINRKKIANSELYSLFFILSASRVKREIQYLKVLRHPHIIKLYEVLTTPTDIIMVMEYAGGELFNYIVEKGKMSESEARKFFQQMIGAIEYCHRHQIVHRDLKPENLLLDAHNNVKIGDFGLSNLMTDGDFLKTSCGSPNYAAPEVISGKFYSGPEVDIWSCGVILYVLVVGKLPFDDDYIPSLFKKINEGIYTIPSFISDPLKELISGMLVVDPAQRITISGIRQNSWFNVDLPNYLQPLPDLPDLNTIEPESEWMDQECIQILVDKLNVDPSWLREALSRPPEQASPDEKRIKVAYQLVLDQKKFSKFESIKKTLLGNTAQSSDYFVSNSISPPPWEFANAKGKEEKFDFPYMDLDSSSTEFVKQNNVSLLKKSLENNNEQPPNDTTLKSVQELEQMKISTIQTIQPLFAKAVETDETHEQPKAGVLKKRTRPKWHLGIRSKSSTQEILLELYKVMKKLNISWKVKENVLSSSQHSVISPTNSTTDSSEPQVDLYKISAKHSLAAEGQDVYFEIQLYKIPDLHEKNALIASQSAPVQPYRFSNASYSSSSNTNRHDLLSSTTATRIGNTGYLVDFKRDEQKSTGNVLQYLDICSKLIIELAHS